MTETVQTYNVKIKFDESFKKLQGMQDKMAKFNKAQEASLKRQVALRGQLNNTSSGGGGRGGGRGGANQEAAALERATEALKNSAFWRKKEAGAAHDLARQNIKNRMENVKSAKQLRRIVAEEKSRLDLVKRQNTAFKKQTFLAERLKTTSKQYLGNWVSFFALASGAKAIVSIGQDFESVRNTMKAVSTDTKEAGENFEFVKGKAFQLGLGLKESAKGFAKMVSARGGMTLEDTKDLFTGVSEMGTLLGLSATESGRAINAIQQMMSKGVVSAEELL